MDFILRFLKGKQEKLFSQRMEDYESFCNEVGYDYRSWVGLDGENSSEMLVRGMIADGEKESHYELLEKKISEEIDSFNRFGDFEEDAFARRINDNRYSVVIDLGRGCVYDCIALRTVRSPVEEVIL